MEKVLEAVFMNTRSSEGSTSPSQERLVEVSDQLRLEVLEIKRNYKKHFSGHFGWTVTAQREVNRMLFIRTGKEILKKGRFCQNYGDPSAYAKAAADKEGGERKND